MAEPGTIGEALHAAMFRRGDNQVDAARAVGVTRQTINDWIKARRIPSGKQAARLARYLAINVGELQALCDQQAGRNVNARLDELAERVASIEALLRAVLDALDQPSSPSASTSSRRARS